jgi:hypothetical protein
MLMVAVIAAAHLATPAQVAADCGGGVDPEYLARYAAESADVVVVARLTAFDAAIGYSFETLAEHAGTVASPIAPANVTDVGACSDQNVKPGEEFVYVAGDRDGYPPLRLIFPHVPGKGWVISHTSDYAPLSRLLLLLGVLPETSTEMPRSTVSEGRHTLPVLLGVAVVLLVLRQGLRRPSRDI